MRIIGVSKFFTVVGVLMVFGACSKKEDSDESHSTPSNPTNPYSNKDDLKVPNVNKDGPNGQNQKNSSVQNDSLYSTNPINLSQESFQFDNPIDFKNTRYLSVSDQGRNSWTKAIGYLDLSDSTCTAQLIAPNLILTAYHCVSDKALLNGTYDLANSSF